MWLCPLALLCAGCSAAQIGDGRGASKVATDEGEAVTVLLNYLGLEGRAIEDEIVGCIRDGIHKVHPALRIVPPDEFRRTAFPDLAPEAAPKSPQYLGMLLSNPAFKERIAPLNIRYLIAIGGDKRVKLSGGDVGSYGFYLGLWAWDRKTRLGASILDLKQARPAMDVEASVEGTAWLVVVEFLPIGAPAFTDAKACAALVDKVAPFLVEQPSER